MSTNRNLPEIEALRKAVIEKVGFEPHVHADFVKMRDIIFDDIKNHISETTLERMWGYSTRGYENVSIATLNLLSRFAGYKDWDGFRNYLKTSGCSESDMFDRESIASTELRPGDILLLGWQPDRTAKVRYLGENRFVAEETANAKLQPGDTFSCLQFQLHVPLFLEDPASADGSPKGKRYGVGLKNGLTMLQLDKESKD